MLTKSIEKLDYKNSIGLLLRITDKSLEHALDSEIKERCKLTGGQWKIILVLAIRQGISQKELADLISVEGHTLVPIVDRMEKDGYLVRNINQKDRRSNSLSLTKKSLDLVDEIVNTILYFRAVFTKVISKQEIDVTKNVLLRITENVEKFMVVKGQKSLPTLLKDK